MPAGHGFRTTATIEVAVDDDERNDAESERRRLEQAAEQPSTKRRPTPAETDDVVRRRKRALTHDRGRNVLGSRQRQRWVHQLDELGEATTRSAESRSDQGARCAETACRGVRRGGGQSGATRRRADGTGGLRVLGAGRSGGRGGGRPVTG